MLLKILTFAASACCYYRCFVVGVVVHVTPDGGDDGDDGGDGDHGDSGRSVYEMKKEYLHRQGVTRYVVVPRVVTMDAAVLWHVQGVTGTASL